MSRYGARNYFSKRSPCYIIAKDIIVICNKQLPLGYNRIYLVECAKQKRLHLSVYYLDRSTDNLKFSVGLFS